MPAYPTQVGMFSVCTRMCMVHRRIFGKQMCSGLLVMDLLLMCILVLQATSGAAVVLRRLGTCTLTPFHQPFTADLPLTLSVTAFVLTDSDDPRQPLLREGHATILAFCRNPRAQRRSASVPKDRSIFRRCPVLRTNRIAAIATGSILFSFFFYFSLVTN